MTTRLCACCEREKSIRGVWYLTPPVQPAATPFVCETCFVGGTPPHAEPASGPGLLT